MSKVGFLNIEVVKGDSFGLVFTYSDKDCQTGALTAIDLSNVSSVESKILDKNNAELLVLSAVVSDATAGEITVSATPAQTSLLTGSSNTKVTENIGSWYCRLVYTDTSTKTILHGKVSLTSVEGA